jgi:hypothetical protein
MPPPDIFRPPPTAEPPEVRGDPLLHNAWQTFIGRWQGIFDVFQSEACEAWDDHQETQLKRRHIAEEEDRQEPSYWPWYAYLFVLLLLFAVEVPFNQQAFEYVFLSTRNVSWAVATIIAVSLLTVAHFVGLAIHRFGYNSLRLRDRFQPTGGLGFPAALNLLGIVFLLTFASFLIYIVSVFRQGYIALISAANGTRVDVAAVLEQTFQNLALQTPGWMMFAINAGIVITAIIICMFAHDSNPQFAKLDAKAKAAKDKFYALIKRYDARIAKAQKTFNNECRDARDAHELGR